MALEGLQFPSSARRFWCLLTDLADKPDHEREIDGATTRGGQVIGHSTDALRTRVRTLRE